MTNFKWTLVILAIILVGLLMVMFIDTASAERYQMAMVYADGGLNVREAPDIESRLYFLLSDGAMVVILETHEDWALVHSKTLIGIREPLGWVHMDYLVNKYEVEIR